MKKLMAGAVVLSLGLFPLGCGGDKPATPPKKPATSSGAASTPTTTPAPGAAAPAAPTTPEKPK